MHSATTRVETATAKVETASAPAEVSAPAAEVSAASTAEVSAATTEVPATSTAEVSTAAPRCLCGQGHGQRHDRGQHDCGNCRSADFHEYLLREVGSACRAEKSDGPDQDLRYETAARPALTCINIPEPLSRR
jgi:hypothetical protein